MDSRSRMDRETAPREYRDSSSVDSQRRVRIGKFPPVTESRAVWFIMSVVSFIKILIKNDI